MRILTPTGYKDVTTLSVGDEVIGRYNVNTIISLDHMEYDLSDSDQNFLDYTINGTYTYFQEQLVLLDDVIAMRHARELIVGDTILADDGSPITITSITTDIADDWWRFHISDDNTFIADGVMLHNSTITMGVSGGILTTNANWVGGTAPGAGDDALITVATTGDVSLSGANWSVHGVDFTGYVHVFSSTGTRTWTVGGGTTLTTAAAFTLGSGMSWTGGGTLTITCDNRSGGLTITQNGIAMIGVTTFNTDGNVAASATTTIADNCDVSGATVNMRRGGFTINSGKSFASTSQVGYTGAAGTHTFTYSGATLNCGSWTVGTGGTFTITGNSTSNIDMNGASQTFSGNGKSYPGTVTIEAGGSSDLMSGANTFVNLTITGNSTAFSLLSLSANQTITGALTCTGNATNYRLIVRSDTYGTTRTLTVTGATVNGQSNVDFRDITASGATISGTSVGDCGGNTGITFTTPKNAYMSNIGTSGNWTDNIWASSSNGSANVANYPIPQDTAILDTHSFTTSAITITIDTPTVSAIDASACTANSHILSASNALLGVSYYGNIIFSSVSITTWTATLGITQIMTKRGTQTFTQNGASAGAVTAAAIQIQNIGGTFQPQDDFTWGGTNSLSGITVINGTFNPLGNVTIPSLADSGSGTKAWTGTSGKLLTLASTGTIYTFQGAGSTPSPSSMNLAITDAGASAKTVALGVIGGVTWGNVTVTTGGAGAVNFTGVGPTINSFNVTGGVTKTITFTASATFNLATPVFFRGAPGQLITITSTSAGTPFTLAYTGTLETNYISLKDSTASGGIPFYAGNNSTNVSGNTNWNFTNQPGGMTSIAHIPNKYVGPMAMRNRFRQPYVSYSNESTASVSASITQVAATITFADGGGTTVLFVSSASITQVAATITFTGGTQTVDTVNNVAITQSAATITFAGGTQTIAIVNNVALTQSAGTITFNGGTQSITASSGAVNASITQLAASITFTGRIPVISTSTGPITPRKYYIDSGGEIYWVLSQKVGLVEKI